LRLSAGDFAADGIGVATAVVPPSTVAALCDLPVFRSISRPGTRDFGIAPEVARLVEAGGLLVTIAAELMGVKPRAARILYFDKTPDVNWAVPWHQDRTIAVAGRIDVPGYAIWSRKGGVDHVEPPEALLSSMVSLRLHLDDCGPDNGPLMAIRGSFRLGPVPASQIKPHVDAGPIAVCCADAGDVVAMRGLTIHASERAVRPGHRRVLHVDFSAADLPGGLRWALA
jgi:hypothetical protein